MQQLSQDDVVSFWRDAGQQKWFRKSDEFDVEIDQAFRGAVTEARNGQLDFWIDDPQSCLALILLLDQFPRNIFRGTPDMFASDAKACNVAARAVELAHDQSVDSQLRAFVYMPFMHSESVEDQRTSVALFTELGAPNNLKHAIEHADIIERFGRFPHRNTILGRTSSDEEMAFLAEGGFSG